MIHKPIIPAMKLLENVKDDQRIWDLFKNGITCTLNQVDSDNGSHQAKVYGISSFEEGALIAAAIRPSFDSWRENFLHRREYTTGSKALDEILAPTQHYILFQENLMSYFDWLGVTPAESIGLIKKISKKKIKPEDFANLETRIKAKWIENTGSEDMFNETWEMIQSCMAYGFATPHACATSLDMLYGAYLKVNYPYEYYTVCFNNYANDEVRTKKLNKELEYFGISMSDIKFRHSKSEYTFSKETRTIYKGMESIKYLNKKVGRELYKLRNNKYTSFTKLLDDINRFKIADSRQLDILIKLDFFSEFGNPNQLLKQVEIYNEFTGTKQLDRDKMDTLIPPKIMATMCEKVTEKRYSNVDSNAIIRYLIDHMPEIQTRVGERIKYECECLGYIQITLPDLNSAYCYVLDVNDKYANRIVTLYHLQDGEQIKCKVKARTFDTIPFSQGDILKVLELCEEKKWGKSPDGQWIRKDETELILKKYAYVKQRGGGSD